MLKCCPGFVRESRPISVWIRLVPAIAIAAPAVIPGVEQACATICATREFWQIRRQNEFVFNRQARLSLYLFPISQMLHMSHRKRPCATHEFVPVSARAPQTGALSADWN
jgi:hypothetical protein